MSIEHPWFTRRFSREDYATVAVLRRGVAGYRTPHFEPVLLYPGGTIWEPEQVQTFGNSGVHKGVKFTSLKFRTARWEFLERVYAQAVAETQRRFPELFAVRWIPCLPNWRELLLPDCHANAADFLEEQIRVIASRGDVRVETGVQLRTRPPHTEYSETEEARTNIQVVVDAERLSKAFTQSVLEQGWAGADIEVPTGRACFGASEIAELLVRPTRFQLELLNHWEATPPATSLDKQMIEAAGDLNAAEVERLLDAGASMNALDDQDETALTAACRSFRNQAPARQQLVQRLIDRGGDVNLFGYDGSDPLISATLSAEPMLVETLLRADADPNHNPWPEDDLDLISAALEYASTDAFLERCTPSGDACAAIERLLEDAGAVIRRP